MKHNIQTNVDENITKARRSEYSLFWCAIVDFPCWPWSVRM
jgi:hypothetical protein